MIALNRVVLYRFIPDQSKRRSTPNWCFCHAANWKCLYVVKGFCLFRAKAHPHESETEKYIQRDTTIERTAQNGRPFFASLPTHSEKLHKTGVGCRNLSALSLSEKPLKDYFTICWHLGRCRGVNN